MAAPVRAPGHTEIRLAELIAALSLATDLADAFPPETALKNCLIALGIAQELGVTGRQLSDVYYAALLRYLGCTSTARETATAFGGDDNATRGAFAGVEFDQPGEMLDAVWSWLGDGPGRLRRARAFTGSMLAGPRFMMAGLAADCEVSTRLATRLGLSAGVTESVQSFFALWDGRGFPKGVAGEQIPLVARIAFLSHMVQQHLRRGGNKASVRAMARRLAGRWVDPAVSEAFLKRADELVEAVAAESVWDAVLDAEPRSGPWVTVSRIDQVAEAFADFADLKSPFTLGHSSGVAALAESAAAAAGLDDREKATLRLAALVHDLGRVSVSNGIWDKPGRLSAAEWERVRLHPYHSERVLARSPALHPLSRLVGSHHERLDGSGYHRGIPAGLLGQPARVLAAADAYQAMREERPHRPAMPPDQAAGELRSQAAAGKLDRQAVGWVLEAAGQPHRRAQQVWPAGLTDREVDVLRKLARGESNKAIGQALFITEETVRSHVKHIYEKIGLASRAGAALFAMEHDLIRG